MSKKSPCPCGSEKDFDVCCQPCLTGAAPASTAEALMRSRYVAYASKDSDYVLATWHPDTRPRSLDLEQPPTKWVGLEIVEVVQGGPDDEAGEVEFIARCKINGKAERLHERSRFRRQGPRWFYVDGI